MIGETDSGRGAQEDLPSGVAGRRTNLGLLLLLPLAVLTGFGAFLVGSGPVVFVVGLHAVVGFAIVLLLPWKSMIARRGLRRRRPGNTTSIVLAVLVVLTLLTGLLHSLGFGLGLAGVGVLWIHVAAGLAVIVPVALHVRRRRIRPRRIDLTRRFALRGLGLSAAAVATYLTLAGLTTALKLPGAARRSTGSYKLDSADPMAVPATSWMFDTVPSIDLGTWRLEVVQGEDRRWWTLTALDSMTDRTTAMLDCTSGWWTEQTWTGVRVARLFPPGTTGTVTAVSATGYRRRLPMTDDLLLATRIDGQPLSPGHGAPLRLVVPGRRGYHWVKWVVRVEHDDRPWWWQPPLPLH